MLPRVAWHEQFASIPLPCLIRSFCLLSFRAIISTTPQRNKHLQMSQRVIHARVFAQGATLVALFGAFIAYGVGDKDSR